MAYFHPCVEQTLSKLVKYEMQQVRTRIALVTHAVLVRVHKI